jgi:PTS system nitrogen regulatory IIA component
MKLPMKNMAGALHLPVSTIERWIRQGRIPIQRVGADVVFSQSAVEKWAATHNLSFSLDGNPAHDHPPAALDTLVSAMKKGKVCHRIRGANAAATLKSAVDCIDYLSKDVRDELHEKLLEREQLASTGIGNGIAIPHPRDPLSKPPETPAITTCFLETGVPFNAIDDQPVFVFFLLISPTVKQHLHLLSRLSYCIRDRSFVSFLHTHPDAAEIHSRVAEFEEQLDDL